MNPGRFFRIGLWCAVLALLATSCAQRHFLRHYDAVRMQSDPLILEAFGDTVPFTLCVHLPAALLQNGIRLRLEPYLIKDSLISPAVLYSSVEKNAIVLSGRRTKQACFRGYFMNFPALQDAHFIIRWSAGHHEKSVKLSERLIGYGISQVRTYSRGMLALPERFSPDSCRSALLARPSQTAASYYLLAVMSARLYDAQGVEDYLLTGISIDTSLYQRACGDVEFIAFRKLSWFPKDTLRR